MRCFILDNYIIGECIKQNRIKKGYSQAELAEKLNVSTNVISRYECGKTAPKREHLFLLAEMLEFSIDELISINNYSKSFSLPSEVAQLMKEATPSQRKIVLSTIKTLLNELNTYRSKEETDDIS